ncbi:MAG: hypothetical protein P4L90_18050 [Rhodopila sp.]|nr:hypothetical protein [Rhodopila sp.]
MPSALVHSIFCLPSCAASFAWACPWPPFSLYLSHFPLLFTCVAACFTLLGSNLPYGANVAIVTVTGIAASLVIAVRFEHWIDRPAILLSRMVSQPRRRAVTPVVLAEAPDPA